MKNRLYIFITIVLATFLCFSCKSEVDKPGKDNAETKKITINVKFPSLEKNLLNERKAFLTDEELDAIIDSYRFTLTAKKTNVAVTSEAETLFSNRSYDALKDFSYEIQGGKWSFTLLAYKENTTELCLSGTCTTTINSDNASLEFEMKYVENASGVFQFTIPIEKQSGGTDAGTTEESYKYHKIVVKSFNLSDENYLVFSTDENNDKVKTEITTNKDSPAEQYFCTYSITLGVGKYIVFIYDAKSDGGYLTYPKINELVYIYGGVTTEKEYLTDSSNSVQNVDVELYVGRDPAESMNSYKIIGYKTDFGTSFPDFEYNYNEETGCLTYKNIQVTDLLLPKLTFDDEYLVGWYTDEARTQKADYVLYTNCNSPTNFIREVNYFWYDISKVSGKLKLYAKFAPRYEIKIDAAGGTLTFNRPQYYYDNEDLVEPEEGSSIYTLQNCAYETSVDIFKANKEDYVFVNWYNDSAYTSPVEDGLLNKNLDANGTINLYARFIDANAQMNIKYLYINNNIENAFNISNYDQFIKASSARSDGSINIYLDERYKPSREGFLFQGWYYDSDFEKPLDYDSYDKRYCYKYSIKDFDPDKEIKIYSKWFEYANDTLNVTIKNYTQNNLKIKYNGITSGKLKFQALPLDDENQKTYTEYTWYVNGEKAQSGNKYSFEYEIYKYVDGTYTNIYNNSSILISCVAKINDEDSDDASLDLLLDLSTDFSISFTEYNSNGLKMTFSETEYNDGENTYNGYKLAVTAIDENIDLEDATFVWYIDGEYKMKDDSNNEALVDIYIINPSSLSNGYHLITCEVVIPDTIPIESYSASYSICKSN